MQKFKRKIGEKTFWQKFYDDYILFRRDFCYKLDCKPQNLVGALEKHLRMHGKTKLNELKKDELWDLETISWRYSGRYRDIEILAKIVARIYLENNKTMIKGSIASHKNSWPFLVFCFSSLALPLTGIIAQIVEPDIVGILLCLPAVLAIWGVVVSRIDSIDKAKELYKSLDTFVSIEEEKLQTKQKQLYSKAKNEEDKIRHEDNTEGIQQDNKK